METPTFLVDVEAYAKRGERLGRLTGILNGEPRLFKKMDSPSASILIVEGGDAYSKFVAVSTYKITSQKQWEELVEDKAVYFYKQEGDMIRMAILD